MSEGGYIFRAGDIVHHEPTGEDWVVAYCDGERLGWCGWPAGEAEAKDCWLKKSVSDEDHVKMLHVLAASRDGRRSSRARHELEKIEGRAA